MLRARRLFAQRAPRPRGKAPARAAVTTTRRFASSSSSSSSAGAFRSAWAKYQALLETHPVATKVATASAIAAAGDVGCQLAIEKRARVDAKRALTFTFLGGVVVPPVLHVWYRFMAARVPGVSTPAVLQRLALDQLGFAPSFLPVFFSLLLTLEGAPETIPHKLRAEWWPTVKANWVVWVPAQLLNFRFVPGNLQVLFANVVGLFWNAYLSYVSHASPHDDHALDADADADADATAAATTAAPAPIKALAEATA